MYSLARLTVQRAAPSFSRSFSVAAVARKDLIQDLYISQLKGYKPTPQDKDAHVGSVRTFSAPSPPQAPALPTDLAGELSAFDAQEPTLGGSAAPAKAAASTEDGGQGVKEWLAFLEADIPKEEAHH